MRSTIKPQIAFWRPSKTVWPGSFMPAMTCCWIANCIFRRSHHSNPSLFNRLSGRLFASVATVESHPVALDQCRRFLAANPQIRRIAAEDTAGSVARIVAQADRTRAAIAGKRAAEQYGGAILREHLEDSSENYTRFLLLTASGSLPAIRIRFMVIDLPHQPGALHSALEPSHGEGSTC